MIGAMPALAVRHERNKHRNQGLAMTTSRDTLLSNGIITQHGRRLSRPVRPNHLPLKPRYASSVSSITTPSSYLSPVPLCTPGSASLAPSTLGVGQSAASTPRVGREPLTAEEMATDYCCWGKFPLLHFLVISLLIGITLLIVGLVQLKPNADSEAKKYLFLGSAAACFVMGFFFMAIRRLRLHHYRKCLNKNRPTLPKDDSNYSITFSGAENDKLSPMDSTALLLPQSGGY